MKTFARTLGCALALAICAAPALAQSPAGQSPAPQARVETRPATTTPAGDTGLWFVPSGEILPARTWSFSAYRVDSNFEQGFTNVARFPITFGIGAGERLEIFGAVTAVTRIDRDIRPLFTSDPAVGGVVNGYPYVNEGWSGNQFGDVWVGAKFNLTSEYRQAPAAFALRGMVKLPTASKDHGAGTGKADVAVDAIVSKELNQRVEVSGYGGFIVRGDPDDFDLVNGFRWGVGAGMPTRKHLRLTAELTGEAYARGTVEANGPAQPVTPEGLPQKSPVTAAIGLTYLASNGFFAGGGVNWDTRVKGRSGFGSYENETGDQFGLQVRVGYHPGTRIYVAPPPPPPPPPPPAPPENRPPTVKARCEPCTVEAGKTAMLIADASDPDGDTITYRWSAPGGAFTSPADRQTTWTAPAQEGPVPATITVTDSRGAAASDSVTIQVIKPAVKEFVFEDVHFDFDRYSLRPEATRALDEAIRTLQENPDLRVEVEGHTCNIGTAEYNLALGERRAVAVREYLTSRGISADRLRTVSYGEERPKYDNAREETRRLNRRAALVVRISR